MTIENPSNKAGGLVLLSGSADAHQSFGVALATD